MQPAPPGPPRAKPNAQHLSAGFTLIELMIAMAIVAIIASVAYPSYTGYTQRSRVAEATGSMSTTRVRLEQYYQDNRNYGSSASACGVAMPASDSFTYSCNWGAGATSQSFLITATGNAAANMSGFTFTVDQNNAQRTTAFVGASGLPANCWMKRPGGSC